MTGITDKRLAELSADVKQCHCEELLHYLKEEHNTLQRVRDEVNEIDAAFKCRDSCSDEAFRNIRSIVRVLRKALEKSE